MSKLTKKELDQTGFAFDTLAETINAMFTTDDPTQHAEPKTVALALAMLLAQTAHIFYEDADAALENMLAAAKSHLANQQGKDEADAEREAHGIPNPSEYLN